MKPHETYKKDAEKILRQCERKNLLIQLHGYSTWISAAKARAMCNAGLSWSAICFSIQIPAETILTNLQHDFELTERRIDHLQHWMKNTQTEIEV